MVYVVKVSGEKVLFEKKKIVHTCKRAGVPKEVAEKIANEVASKVKEGTTTKHILDLVLEKLDSYERQHSSKYRLKKAIADLSPEEHEFEKYIEHLLKAHGYKTKWDQIIQGECIEHQMDIVAEKDSKRYLVECKHHINPHRFCGLGTCIQTWAVLDDIQEGYKKGKIKEMYDNIWLVCNTKFSEHALKYSRAKGIMLTGWNYPKKLDLRELIESKGMYPVTILELPDEVRVKLSNAGILLLQELVSAQIGELQKKTKIDANTLKKYIEMAQKILKS